MMLSHDGQVRLQVAGFSVFARAGRADWNREGSELGQFAEGADQGGSFTETRAEARAEWCSASLTLRNHPAPDLLSVSASARSWDSERWWAGGKFGLRGERTLELVLELPQLQAGMACAMVEEWWTQPFFVESVGDVPELSQFFLWRDKDGRYGAIVPLVGGAFTSLLAGDGARLKVIVACGDEGRLQADGPLFCAGTGTDPYQLIRRLYEQGMQFAGRPGKLRTEKAYPRCFEQLGWCTWDAFYRDVTAEKVKAQLTHFNTLKLPVGFLLVDDGWYPIADQMMVTTATDTSKFPTGLAPLFAAARHEHGIKHVGVWHALTGYWSGIHPQHELVGTQSENLLSAKGGRLAPAQDAGGSFAFLNSWHASLAAERTDFIKVDGQAAIHRYSRDLVAIPEAAAAVQRALQASAGAHFQGQILNCMSMSQELAWSWCMSNVTRSSPDYMIDGKEPNTAGHARANAYNSLWIGQLTWCDWDMFRSDQASAPFHAALRAVSGGPIYLSDGLRTTVPQHIWPLIASDGQILRCDDVGVPTEDWLLTDPAKTPRAFKIRNRAGGSFVVGLFNLCDAQTPVPGSVSSTDVGLPANAEVVIWSYRRRAGRKLAPGETYELELPALGSDVVTLVRPSEGFAAIGLAEKLIAGKTIVASHRFGTRALLQLSDAGQLIAYSENPPSQVQVDGQLATFSFSDHWLSVSVPVGSSLLVEIDWA